MNPLHRDPKYQSQADMAQFQATEQLFAESQDALINRVDAFAKYASRQSLAKFLVRHEIFRKIIDVSGSIVECGVLSGQGLFTFAKLSSIYEPVNHPRKIIGFDTFEGFPHIHNNDARTGDSSHFSRNALKGSNYEEMLEAVRVYDLNRPLSHIPKIELVKGDVCVTAKAYVQDNPHLSIALLNLDLDLYEPTKVALETFLPHMPKGAVIVFDEFNAKMFPGETVAVKEVLGLRNVEIKRLPIDSYISYCVL